MSDLLNTVPVFGYETKGVEFEEVFLRPIYTDPTVQSLVRVETGISYKATMALDNDYEYLVKSAPDCDTATDGDQIELDSKVLEVCELGFDRSICFKDLKNYFRDSKLKLDPNYMTGDAYIKSYFDSKISLAMLKDVTRIAFFGNTALGNANYNSCDGFWKLIQENVGAYGITRTTIVNSVVENAGNSVSDAQAFLLYFKDLYYNASTALKSVENSKKAFLVTGSIYDAVDKAYDVLKANNGFIDGLQKAGESLTFKGITITAMRKWDEYIANDFASANPHRIIYYFKENLVIGFDGQGEEDRVEVLEDRVGKKYIYRGYFKMGVQILHFDLIDVAY